MEELQEGGQLSGCEGSLAQLKEQLQHQAGLGCNTCTITISTVLTWGAGTNVLQGALTKWYKRFALLSA